MKIFSKPYIRNENGDIMTCLHCLLSANKDNNEGKIYCYLKQKSHNVIDPCKEFVDENIKEVNDSKIKSVIEEKRINNRHKQILFWSKVTAAILFVTLMFNLLRYFLR